MVEGYFWQLGDAALPKWCERLSCVGGYPTRANYFLFVYYYFYLLKDLIFPPLT
jgi:hypothetical protein